MMKCTACGKEIPDDSKFCQKCGRKIEKSEIVYDDLKEELLFLQQASDRPEGKEYYKSALEAVAGRPIRNIKYEYAASPGEVLVKDYFDEDGNLIIKIDDPEAVIKFAAAYVMSEFRSLHDELENIASGQHDDRIGLIRSAVCLYERKDYEGAARNLSAGLEQLRREIDRQIKYFDELPKSSLQKMLTGKLQSQTHLSNLYEGLQWYKSGILFLTMIDLENGHKRQALKTVSEQKKTLEAWTSHHGFQRVLEYDDDHAEDWKQQAQTIMHILGQVNTYIEASDCVFQSGEDHE